MRAPEGGFSSSKVAAAALRGITYRIAIREVDPVQIKCFQYSTICNTRYRLMLHYYSIDDTKELIEED